jgi:hypothetical protein
LEEEEEEKEKDEAVEELPVSEDQAVRTMCGSRTGGWSLPCVMSD